MNRPEGHQYRLKVVTQPGAGLGFRLAGVLVEEVPEASAVERIATLLGEPDLGVLAVEDELLRQVPEAVLVRAARDGVPIVLPFTLPRRLMKGGGGEAYVSALIRRAIGYHIKIQA
jgi:V/A-type H+-transporting ATPase subunit F